MMLANTSQLLLRNLNDLSGRVLLAEPPADQLAAQLAAQAPLLQFTCYTTDQATASLWQNHNCYFGVQPQFDNSFDCIVLFYPKSKEQLAFTLHQLKTVLTDSTAVFVVGDNKGGIKSLSAHARKLGLQANKLDNAKHSLWFSLHGDFGKLAASTTASSTALSFNVVINDISLTLCSLPGVFNHGKLDTGTALLLNHLQHITAGNVLDFACGCGVIGAFLKKRTPAIQLFSSDISALAVSATEQTLAANNLEGTVIAADGLPDNVPVFDHIVSNPPFHTGIKTDYSISQQFISQSVSRLKPGGSLTLVANNHLAYQELLTAAFGKTDILARKDGFIVYHSVKR
ncbi:class I SAM-dependent methyltransferase [Chromatiaceae bacterium AAb-1]|nr:class I SAM-dependent methyltransferase [Chromatiaceae bacterium AAb-1]